MTDIFIEKKVLDHGYVRLVEYLGSDEKIDQRARTSYDGRGTSKVRTLLRHLLRCKHTSPFEMAEFVFDVAMPIHVARQWHRHRTASINEVSARYTTLPSTMYVPRPEHIHAKQDGEKQGRGGFLNEDQKANAAKDINEGNEAAYDMYDVLLAGDVAPETARGNLPLNTYTHFIWKIDLHNLMHFMNLRCDTHAQWEIRQYANVIQEMVTGLFPLSMEAWGDYTFASRNVSRWAFATVQDIIRLMSSGDTLKEAIDTMHGVMVDTGKLTEREWKEDVLPFTEIRF